MHTGRLCQGAQSVHETAPIEAQGNHDARAHSVKHEGGNGTGAPPWLARVLLIFGALPAQEKAYQEADEQ